MSIMTSQITGNMIVYSTICSGSNQRKHQSSTSMAFIRGIHWWTVNFPAQRASNSNSSSIWWCHHVLDYWLFVRGISRLLVDSPHKRAVMESSDTCFVFILNKLFNKKSSCQLLESPWPSCDVTLMDWVRYNLQRWYLCCELIYESLIMLCKISKCLWKLYI